MKVRSVKFRIIGVMLILSGILVNVSCLNRQFYDGKSELVSVSDTMLNDSSIITGFVHRVDMPSEYVFQGEYEIWIDNTSLSTTNDLKGFYYLKTIPGTYTIKCQSQGNEWKRLIDEMSAVKLEKNKKTRIDFLVGYATE